MPKGGSQYPHKGTEQMGQQLDGGLRTPLRDMLPNLAFLFKRSGMDGGTAYVGRRKNGRPTSNPFEVGAGRPKIDLTFEGKRAKQLMKAMKSGSGPNVKSLYHAGMMDMGFEVIDEQDIRRDQRDRKDKAEAKDYMKRWHLENTDKGLVTGNVPRNTGINNARYGLRQSNHIEPQDTNVNVLGQGRKYGGFLRAIFPDQY